MRRLVIAIVLTGSTFAPAAVGQVGAANERTLLSNAQQRQYQQCVDTILHLQTEVRTLSATPSRPEPAITIYARHRSPVRLAAISVHKCYAGFVKSLSPDQRTAMKQGLRRVSNSWFGIQRHLVTLDDDLYQHSLDNGRFTLHAQGFQRAIADYLEQYRKLASENADARNTSSMIGIPGAQRALRTGDNITVVPLTDCL